LQSDHGGWCHQGRDAVLAEGWVQISFSVDARHQQPSSQQKLPVRLL
jgi:hypothetical protein